MIYPGPQQYPAENLYPTYGRIRGGGTTITGERLVEGLEPWMTDDLAVYLRALGTMFTEVELLGFDHGEALGWEILLDPDRCPPRWLPYLAQYVGEKLPVGIGAKAAREWIKDAPNQRRGTVESIIRAAQRSLTGERHVGIIERVGGDEDRIAVVTYDDETPRESVVLADLRTVIPADIVLDYNSFVGQSWGLLNDAKPTWAAVKSSYATWRDVGVAQLGYTGYTFYSRPRPS